MLLLAFAQLYSSEHRLILLHTLCSTGIMIVYLDLRAFIETLSIIPSKP